MVEKGETLVSNSSKTARDLLAGTTQINPLTRVSNLCIKPPIVGLSQLLFRPRQPGNYVRVVHLGKSYFSLMSFMKP